MRINELTGRPWDKRVVQGLQSFLLQIDITEIIVQRWLEGSMAFQSRLAPPKNSQLFRFGKGKTCLCAATPLS